MGVIDIKGLSFSYGNNLIFDNLNLSIKENSFTTVLGNNKSGKTTLIKLLLGFDKANGITIFGKSLNDNKREIRKQIGVVFSNPSSFFVFNTVEEELSFVSNNEEDVLTVIKELSIENLLLKRPNELSLDKQYLTMLALCLVSNVKIIILDNIIMNNNIRKILKKINKKGITIINFTTNVEDVLYGNYTVILNKVILFSGSNRKLLNHLDVLKSLNMDVPFILDLSEKLMFYDLIDKKYTNMEKLVNDVWKYVN